MYHTIISTIDSDAVEPQWKIATICPNCGKSSTLGPFSLDQVERFQRGEGLITVFPELDADDREKLISGCCPVCWEELFGDRDGLGFSDYPVLVEED